MCVLDVVSGLDVPKGRMLVESRGTMKTGRSAKETRGTTTVEAHFGAIRTRTMYLAASYQVYESS